MGKSKEKAGQREKKNMLRLTLEYLNKAAEANSPPPPLNNRIALWTADPGTWERRRGKTEIGSRASRKTEAARAA